MVLPRFVTPEYRREAARRWRKSPKGRAYYYEYFKAYRKRHQELVNARRTLYRAVKTGKIKRPGRCSECRKPCEPDGHHDDHSKPLEVRWLCEACHVLAEKGLI
jgi:hypothetical protein